jgi:MoaA/NifB/PqqE/SkfB family radical SAM enzyme
VNAIPELAEFCIVGGEPLLFQDQILDILESIAGHQCRTVIVTNGNYLTTDLVKKIAPLRIHIVVSVDTMDRDHWAFVRGRDTYDLVIDNIRYARGIFRPDQLSIQSVLAKETKDHLAACRNMTFARRITHAAISSEQGNSVG